jgi:hypothetical protein
MTEPNSHFPEVKGNNLEGTGFNLPYDFKENLNVVITAFRMNQTHFLEEWGPPLEDFVGKNPGVAFFELPVLGVAYSPFRRWIDGGMKVGILEEKSRKRTITLYTNKRQFRSKLNIPNEETVYIFLIDRSGRVFWRTEGGFTKEKLGLLQGSVNAAIDILKKERSA